MAIKVGISGFGRIGRVVIRAAMDMPGMRKVLLLMERRFLFSVNLKPRTFLGIDVALNT